MQLTPDDVLLWSAGSFTLRLTVVLTWIVMAVLAAGSWWVTRHLTAGAELGRGQNLLETLVGTVLGQIEEVAPGYGARLLPFVGTLFVFIATSNLLGVVPGFVPPTAALSTTTALALSVFVAVPIYGIQSRGLGPYLRQYTRPTILMLPFNILGELTRTVALAVRLFGNVMSGAMIAAILLALVPLLFPVAMQALGLLTGLVQAYVFAILALIYVASALRSNDVDPAPTEGPPRRGLQHGP